MTDKALLCFNKGANSAARQSTKSQTNKQETQMSHTLYPLRRQRLCGKHIALQTGVSPATVSRVLRRAGLSRMKDMGPTGTGCAL